MEKKEPNNSKVMKNQNLEAKKTLSNSKNQKKDKPLPWWVELLFVQIGLPDKYLVKILKTKKNFNERINNDKKYIFTFFSILAILAYFYPVVKQSKNMLKCEISAKNFLVKNKNLVNFNKNQISMTSTNFCNGGKGIFEMEIEK